MKLPLKFFIITFLILLNHNKLFAQVGPLDNKSGHVVTSITDLTPFVLTPGTFSNCVQSKGDESKHQLIVYKCDVDGGVFSLTRADKGVLDMPIKKLVYIRFDASQPDDISKGYYLKGTWSEDLDGSSINSDVTVVINVRRNGNNSGYVANNEFNITRQLHIKQ